MSFLSATDTDCMGISDYYSALSLIIGGIAGLLMLQVTARYSTGRSIPGLTERVEAIRIRFESRKRWSWIMFFFGTLWLLQLLLESNSTLSNLL
jgi:hypothetical protein